MNNVSSFVLATSGQPLTVGNSVNASSSLTVQYTVAGLPLNLTLYVSGIKNASGEVAVLDSYISTGSTVRTINLSDTYDQFRFVGVWSGIASIAVQISSTGNGATFSAALDLANIATQ